jgi:hypothetical protein
MTSGLMVMGVALAGSVVTAVAGPDLASLAWRDFGNGPSVAILAAAKCGFALAYSSAAASLTAAAARLTPISFGFGLGSVAPGEYTHCCGDVSVSWDALSAKINQRLLVSIFPEEIELS